MALLLIDLDRFGDVDKRFGTETTNSILQEIRSRFLACVRENDTIARLGSDEFGVVIDEISSDFDLSMVADRIFNSLKDPIIINGTLVLVTASVGISCYPKDGDTVGDLIRMAQLALYNAKKLGGDRINTI